MEVEPFGAAVEGGQWDGDVSSFTIPINSKRYSLSRIFALTISAC